LLQSGFFSLTLANEMQMPAHPRLWVTANEIPFIKQRIKHPDFAFLQQVFEQQKNIKQTVSLKMGYPMNRYVLPLKHWLLLT